MNVETNNEAPQPPSLMPSLVPGTVLDMSPRGPHSPPLAVNGVPAKPYQYDPNTPVVPSSVHPDANFDILAATNAQPSGVVVMPDGRVLTEAEADAEDDARIAQAFAARNGVVSHTSVPPMPQPNLQHAPQRMPAQGVEAPRLVQTAPPMPRQAPALPATQPRRSPFRFHENFCAGLHESSLNYLASMDVALRAAGLPGGVFDPRAGQTMQDWRGAFTDWRALVMADR